MDSLKTNFGKRKVSQKAKTSLVQDVFTNVARKYDVMNDFMSFGAHRLWKREFVEIMNIQNFDKIIDVGTGTGDLIDIILKKKMNNPLYSLDLNSEMLSYAKKQFDNTKVKFIKADAEKIPFQNNTFDKYIISFCLRNVTDINKALFEANRILKPGGIFYCLEFSKPENQIINNIYSKYKKKIIPKIGEWIARNKEAYRYLEESIDLFPSQKNLLNNLNKVGFVNNKYINMFNGIVSVHIGYKI